MRGIVGRPKKYDQEQVLEAATQLFWEKGYEGTSISDLVEATGVHRRSMYEEFGGKEGLFLQCIEYYAFKCDDNIQAFAVLTHEPRGIGNIEAFFQDRLAYAVSGSCNGCLLVNTSVERDQVTGETRRKVDALLLHLEKEFVVCLKAAQKKGEIPKGKDCQVLARYLLCFLEGVLVMGKTNPPKTSLDGVLKTMISTLTR